MHYLEETRPQRPLMPQDVYKRAKVRVEGGEGGR